MRAHYMDRMVEASAKHRASASCLSQEITLTNQHTNFTHSSPFCAVMRQWRARHAHQHVIAPKRNQFWVHWPVCSNNHHISFDACSSDPSLV